jgi:hypothetical protein
MVRFGGVIKAVFLVLILGVWANHCIIGDLYAASRKESQKQDSPCHHDDKGGSKSHHTKCQGEGCCQPAISPSGDFLAKVAVEFPAMPMIVNSSVPLVHHSYVTPRLVPEATGPPLLANSLISSLTSAPNAPPRS